MAKNHFAALDGIRGIAAIAVLLHHVGTHAMGAAWGPHGYLAVDLFFLLSGFVVASAYEPKLATGLSVGGYVLNIRIARMYPMIILGSLIGLAAAAHSTTFAPALYFASALLLVPSLGYAMFPLNPVMWSLMLELYINIIHAVLYPHLSNRVLAIIVAIGSAALIVTTWSSYGLNIGWGIGEGNAVGGLVRVCTSFPAGILIYRLHAAGHLPRVPIPFLGSVALLAIVMLVPVPQSHHLPPLHDLVAVFVGFPLIIIAGTQERLGEGMEKVSTALADLSYPLYAIHFPLILMTITAFGYKAVTDPHRWMIWVPFCLAVTAFAWLIHQWIEEPFQEWRKARRRSPLSRSPN